VVMSPVGFFGPDIAGLCCQASFPAYTVKHDGALKGVLAWGTTPPFGSRDALSSQGWTSRGQATSSEINVSDYR